MADDESIFDDVPMPDIATLIQGYMDRTGLSARQMAERVDHAIQHQTISKYVGRNGPREFPEPDTIRAWARVLEETPWAVLAAFAESLGVDVRAPATRLPPGFDQLPSDARFALIAVARAMVGLRESGAAPDRD